MTTTQECPQCGAAVLLSERRCGYCKAEFFITSIAYLSNVSAGSIGKYMEHYTKAVKEDPANAEALLGLGLCYLQTGAYPLASKAFDKVVELNADIAQGYYYSVLCAVRGRRLRAISLNEVRAMEPLINTAIQLDGSRNEFKLLAAMVKRDYYEYNGLRVPPPSCAEILSEIGGKSVPAPEVARLFESVKVGDSQVYMQQIIVG